MPRQTARVTGSFMARKAFIHPPHSREKLPQEPEIVLRVSGTGWVVVVGVVDRDGDCHSGCNNAGNHPGIGGEFLESVPGLAEGLGLSCDQEDVIPCGRRRRFGGPDADGRLGVASGECQDATLEAADLETSVLACDGRSKLVGALRRRPRGVPARRRPGARGLGPGVFRPGSGRYRSLWGAVAQGRSAADKAGTGIAIASAANQAQADSQCFGATHSR